MGRVRVAIVSLVFLLTPLAFANGGATESVYSALKQQDQWLSGSASGEAWQAYLRTAELRAALAEPSMDRRLLAAVLARYNSSAPGVELGPFQATRRALTALADELGVPQSLRWAEQLTATTPFTAGISPGQVAGAKQ